MDNIKKQRADFMIEFAKSSKVWGLGMLSLGVGLITVPLSILIHKNLDTLSGAITLGLLLILCGVFMLIRNEWDLW